MALSVFPISYGDCLPWLGRYSHFLMSHGTFRPTQPITKAAYLAILSEGDSSAIAHAIIDAVDYVHDYTWLVEQVRYLLQNGEGVVVNCALIALADIARVEQSATRAEMCSLLAIVETDVRYASYVEIAKDDIDQFLPQTRAN